MRYSDFLWVKIDGREYVITDPGRYEKAREAMEPVRALGKLQVRLGGQQGRLGARQGKLGEQQEPLAREQGRLGEQQSAASRKMSEEVRRIIFDAIEDGAAIPVR